MMINDRRANFTRGTRNSSVHLSVIAGDHRQINKSDEQAGHG
jgi:hypothetical protein